MLWVFALLGTVWETAEPARPAKKASLAPLWERELSRSTELAGGTIPRGPNLPGQGGGHRRSPPSHRRRPKRIPARSSLLPPRNRRRLRLQRLLPHRLPRRLPPPSRLHLRHPRTIRSRPTGPRRRFFPDLRTEDVDEEDARMTAGLFFACALAACPQEEHRIAVEEHGTDCIVLVPSAYDDATLWPLLVLLHGAGDRAEKFLRGWRTRELTNHFLVCAINSPERAWSTANENLVLDVVRRISRIYSVDRGRRYIAGFSSGGFLTAYLGIKHFRVFAGTVVMSAGDGYAEGLPEYEQAARTRAFYLLAGEKEGNARAIRRMDANLEKAGCKDKKTVIVPGMGHTFRGEDIRDITQWLRERAVGPAERSSGKPKELLLEAERFLRGKEYGAAYRLFSQVVKQGDERERRRAENGLAEIARAGKRELERAEKLRKSDPLHGLRALEEVADRFRGTEWGGRARRLLRER